jgi:hypothetical protein
MLIYLAGGVTGNLSKLWKEMMKIYLAGTYSRPFVIEEAMKIYLAGNAPWRENGIYDNAIINNKPFILESYFYIKEQNQWILKMRPFFKEFLLDSGAFTFIQNNSTKCNWDKYVEDYANFINIQKIDLFFELDIDSIVGIKEVERLRNKLEKLTNKQCIPVWHKSRGKEYWSKMISDYKYIAIGGIVSGEIKKNEYYYFNYFLNEANKNNVKVHGLGFTNLVGLKQYKFYSVDSTAWLYGNRGGFLYHFNGESIEKIIEKNKRLRGKEAAIHNFNEWLKFSNYAEINL